MKPIASLSLDLDNKWSYLKTRGDRKWMSYPSYLGVVVPRFLDFLSRRNLRITIFIVGYDAASDKNAESMSAIAATANEIGNHSFRHEPWLHLYSESDLHDEIRRASDAIEKVTGKTPRGFRGPGFSRSKKLTEILIQNNFLYDCSALPTFIGPLARAFYFMNGPKLTADELNERRELFGRFSDGFQRLRPTLIRGQSGEIVCIPVTTFPIIRTPIHFSYLLYLATISPKLARLYWRAALNACFYLGVQPSLLLHSLDFLGCDDDGDLAFFPGMQLSAGKKIELLDEFIDDLCQKFRITTLAEHCSTVSQIKEGNSTGDYIEDHNQ